MFGQGLGNPKTQQFTLSSWKIEDLGLAERGGGPSLEGLVFMVWGLGFGEDPEYALIPFF